MTKRLLTIILSILSLSLASALFADQRVDNAFDEFLKNIERKHAEFEKTDAKYSFKKKKNKTSKHDQFNQAIVDAAKFGHNAVIYLMLEQGASITTKALVAALKYDQYETLRMLLKKVDNPNVRFKIKGEYHTLLSYLCLGETTRAKRQMAEYLIKKGAKPSAINSLALRIASKHASPELIEILINQGADPSASNSEALLNAVQNERSDAVIDLLIDNGAVPKDALRAFKDNPVHMFYKQQYTRILEDIIDTMEREL